MQKVVIINLNGRAYQLDEGAYDALRAYLDRAETQLAANPDQAEIVSDLEQAIAEKCDRYLSPGKNVVTAAEIAQVIEEMGPVHDATGAEAAGAGAAAGGGADTQAPPRADAGTPRRLYRIREGAMVAGICNGFAAFFNVDVTVVRLIFVILAVITSGGLLFAYLILMFVLPEASTSEERAAAHGQPFNAQELIDRVKQSARFPGNRPWFGAGDASARRHRRRAHRAHLRAQRRAFAHRAAEPPVDYAGQVMAGFFVPIASVISAALFVGLALAIISLIMTGAILGWQPPDSMPFWAQIVVLVVGYHLLAWPLHVVSHGPFYGRRGPAHGWLSMWGGILWIGFTALFMWLAYQHVPGVKEFIDQFPDSLHHRVTDNFTVLVRWLQ